jgi:short-subunit dehydrogenase
MELMRCFLILNGKGYGVIINNISVGGFLPVAYGTSYSASKFGLRGFFEALQSELARYPHIHVCNMYPSFLDSPGIQHAANFTGVHVRPAPPVFDPMHLADTMVKLAQYPRSYANVHLTTPPVQVRLFTNATTYAADNGKGDEHLF